MQTHKKSQVIFSGATVVFLCVLIPAFHAFADTPVDLLPDLVVDHDTLLDNEVVRDSDTQHIYLRFSTGTANIGDGPMEVVASGWKNGGGAEKEEIQISQRVYRSDNSHYDVPAGSFISNPPNQYIQVEDAAQYHLRVILPSDGVGDILATSEKTSYCLRDSRVYNADLPGSPTSAQYSLCDGTVEGISIGYEDVYTKTLPHQFIDLTGVPDGMYWLEVVVDPDNKFLEKDETNNVWRIKVNIDTRALNGNSGQGLLAILLELFQQFFNFIRSLFGL